LQIVLHGVERKAVRLGGVTAERCVTEPGREARNRSISSQKIWKTIVFRTSIQSM